MPIAYLDVPQGIDADRKRELMRALYEALNEAYPFPDDHRVFLREWSADTVSQNGVVPAEPFRPVFVIHGPQGAGGDAKRSMLRKIDAAVADAYGLPDFMIFMHEYPLDLVAHEGGLLADNAQRVEEQKNAYS
jgi:hypothetical protein